MNKNLSQAVKHHGSHEFEEAKRLYNEILSAEPDNIETLHLLGILEAQCKNFELALKLVSKAIKINPKIASLYNSLGNILHKIGREDEAKSAYEAGLKIDSSLVSLHNNLGNVLYKLDKFDDALPHYMEAIKINPNYVDAHYNLGLLLVKQNKTDEALSEFLTTVKIDNENISAHNQIAKIFYQRNQLEEAIKHLQESLKIDKNDITALQDLGAIFGGKKEFKEAISLLQKALDLNPNHIETISNLGSIFLEQNDLESSLQYHLKLLNLAPGFDVYYNIGIIYMYKDRCKEAIPYFIEALKIKPNDFAALSNLGTTYLKMDDSEKAIEKYTLAIKSKPDDKEISYLLDALTHSENTMPNIKEAPKEYLQHLFDQYASYFDTHLTKFLEYRVPYLLYEAVVSTYQKNDENKESGKLTVVDLGCGTGLGGEKFRKLAKDLIGIDISEKMLAAAKQKNIYDKLILEDISIALEGYNNNVDLIISADTLVYTGDLDYIFKKCSNALKQGGYFAFTLEDTNTYPYTLQKSARFSHSLRYIEELLSEYHFTLEYSSKVVLRKQKNVELEGTLYVIKH